MNDTVLILERDEVASSTLHDVLSKSGYDLIPVDSPQAMLDYCRNALPDLILVDDEPDGLDVCQQVRALAENTVIIVLITQDDDERIENALDAGATDYIIKPLRGVVLLRRLERTLQVQHAQNELRVNQETFQLALQAAEVGIWDWDMERDYVYYSPNWLHMLGYQEGDLPPSPETWRSLIHPDDRARVEETLTEHINNDVAYEIEHRLKTKSGDWKWILALGKVVRRDADGRPLRMAGTHRDVHTTIMMQKALQESEERHRIISNTISDYAYSYIVAEDGYLKKDWSTQAFHEITGYSFEEMDSNGYMRLIHPDDMGIAEQRFKKLLSGQVDISEFRIITKSGDIRWLRDHGHPVVDPQTRRVIHIYGAAQDITQRKHDEEMLRQQALELSSRNEELDAFAYTVAHDLKNSIASMMGFASLIQNYHSRMTADKLLEYIDLILDSGYKLKETINALLTLSGVSKIDQPEMGPVDMYPIIEDVKRRLYALIEERHAQINLPEDWPVAMGYGPWIEEVWMNYISNAIKYGGTPPQIDLGAQVHPDEQVIRFWVRDNGRGLTEEEQQRVFTPFTRLNHVKTEGHGLGLSVVQRIVTRLGGDLAVSSVVGQGSEFSFTLPLAAPDQVP